PDALVRRPYARRRLRLLHGAADAQLVRRPGGREHHDGARHDRRWWQPAAADRLHRGAAGRRGGAAVPPAAGGRGPGAPPAPTAPSARSFTPAGGRIPPVLDVNQVGDLIQGTADAAFSVLRIARIDPFNGGAPLYDLSDRLEQQRGPILIQNMQA